MNIEKAKEILKSIDVLDDTELEEAIKTVLEELRNSISKEVLENKLEELKAEEDKNWTNSSRLVNSAKQELIKELLRRKYGI